MSDQTTLECKLGLENYEQSCPICNKHFIFEYDSKYVYVRPIFLHLAHDHTKKELEALL